MDRYGRIILIIHSILMIKHICVYLDCLAEKLIGSILEAAILLLKSKTGEVVKASLVFVKVRLRVIKKKSDQPRPQDSFQ